MSAYEQMVKGNTPMLILSLLAEKPMHGYAIAKEIGQRTADLLRFREGTLYPTLHEMEQKGWIVGKWESTDGGRERKVFRKAIEAVMQRKSPQSAEGGIEPCTT